METRFVPDAPGAWLVYELGALVLALPPEFRAAGDAAAAMPRAGVDGVLAALRSSGIADAAPFAVLHADADGLHVALRGPATVSAGTVTLTGLGSEPWLERVLPGVGVARLTVPGGEWTLAPAPRRHVAPPVAVTPLFDESHDVTEVPAWESSGPPPEHGTVAVDEIARVRARRAAGLAPAMPLSAVPLPPSRFGLQLPDGSCEPFEVVLVGRAPVAPATEPGTRLVRLDGDGDISRNHARVALEGDTVVVTDLGSRNGTIVRIPGRPAQKLRAREPTPVLVGTVIDFGGGIELSIREL